MVEGNVLKFVSKTNKPDSRLSFIEHGVSIGVPKKMAETLYDRLAFFEKAVFDDIKKEPVNIKLTGEFTEDQIAIINNDVQSALSEWYDMLFDRVMTERMNMEFEFYALQYPDWRTR